MHLLGEVGEPEPVGLLAVIVANLVVMEATQAVLEEAQAIPGAEVKALTRVRQEVEVAEVVVAAMGPPT